MAAAVLVLSYVLILLITVLYIRWVVKRYRKEREEKAAKRLGTLPPPAPAPAPPPSSSSLASPPVMPTAMPGDVAPSAGPTGTVVDAVRGISLPCDLAPLIDLPVNTAALDRATFVTRGVPVQVVIDEMGTALEAIGHDVRWADGRGIARRGDDELQIQVHGSPRAQGFWTAPEDGVVVDLWIAAR
jgi:hypothetical protein